MLLVVSVSDKIYSHGLFYLQQSLAAAAARQGTIDEGLDAAVGDVIAYDDDAEMDE